MATLLLFGPARTAAGVGRATVEAGSLGELRSLVCERFGPGFEAVLSGSSLWLNGEPADGDPVLGDDDEVAVVPPVSGGA
jgi:molybdopterin synthase sulfur carrier subunit